MLNSYPAVEIGLLSGHGGVHLLSQHSDALSRGHGFWQSDSKQYQKGKWVWDGGSGTSLKLSKAARMMSCPPRTRHTAASSSSTRALVLKEKGQASLVAWWNSLARGQGSGGGVAWTAILRTETESAGLEARNLLGYGAHLGFLLLRLRAISLTQAGWFITRLKPDCGERGGQHLQAGPQDCQHPQHSLGHTALASHAQVLYIQA